MNKEIINGVECLNFGVGTYSCGMEAIVFPTSFGIESVKSIDGIYLHPIMEADSQDIYTLRGTQEQFDEFYKQAVKATAVQYAAKSFDFMNDKEYPMFEKTRKEFIELFKPWYERR